MEPFLTPQTTAKDLIIPISMLDSWGETSFQRFLESGVYSDMLEAIEQKTNPIIEIEKRGMILPSTVMGNVSVRQALKFLPALNEGNLKIFCLNFRAWSVTVGWWEKHRELDWVMRDEWRMEMGLKPINPVFEKDKQKIFLRMVSSHSFLSNPNKQKGPPKGYRFISLEEYQGFVLPKMNYYVILQNKGELSALTYDPGCKLISPYSHFRDKMCYLALAPV